MLSNIGMPEIIVILILVILLLIPFLLLIDILRSDFKKESNKIVWIIMVIFLPVLGFLLYLVIGRKQKV
jgi:hypothetical protein